MTNHFFTRSTGWLLALAIAFFLPFSGNAAPETVGTIQGYVWNDLNNNGLQDNGEPGLGGVWVQVETPVGGWVNGGYTNMAGDYSYPNIPAGSYKVKVANPGNGFNASSQDVGGNDAIDSDTDIYGFTPVFTLAAGQTVDIDGGLTTGGQCYTPVYATSSNVSCSGSTFSFQITATGGTAFGGVSWGWNGAGLSMQPYGQPITVGPFPCGSPATVIVTDVDNPFCTATVTVNSPACCVGSSITITCPIDMNMTAPAGATGMVVNYTTPTATTTCTAGGLNVTRTSGPASGSVFPVGTTQVCFKATDACGNVGTCCFNVKVTAPTGNCDSKTDGCIKVDLLSITTAPNGRETLTFKITSTCQHALSYAAFELPPNCWAISGNSYTGTSGRKYTVENGTNNPFFSIKFNSDTEGIKNGESETFSITLDPSCNPLANMRVQVKENGLTHLVTINTTNCGGNPTTNLTISCPVDMNITAATGSSSAIVTYATPTATTTCAGGATTITRTSGPASGSSFPVGTTQVCHKATDNCGNVKTCCFNVTVTSTSSSVQITCPLGMNLTAPAGATGMVVTYATPTGTTTCAAGGLSITRTSGLASGSAFPIGTTQVCYKATDACGNVGTCCFNVTVTATPPPGGCDSETDGCIKVELLSNATAPNGRATLKFKVTSTCPHALSYAAFELPPGCWAISGNSYTGTSGRKYTVENGTNNPFFSIKFNGQTEGIKNGESETFSITLDPSCSPLTNMRVQIKEDGTTHLVTINTSNCGGSNLLSSNSLTFNAFRSDFDVDLKWLSSTGERNDYFIVEHSTDGSNWAPIKKEEGEGAKGEMLYFGATHTNPPAGENFYRLVVFYHDGTSTTTNQQLVIMPGKGSFGIFPNPASEMAYLDLSEFVPSNGGIEVRVLNHLGIAVFEKQIDRQDSPLLVLDLSGWKNGQYFIQLESAGQRKMVKKLAVLRMY